MKPAVIVTWLARWLALAGGVVLVAMTMLTVVSVVGRSLVSIGLAPVEGDFELVQAGVGFAVFAFLPWCQLRRGHATVDVFTSFLPDRANHVIDVVAEVLMSIVVILIAWRLFSGTMEKMRYGETTFILQYPIWWSYAACLVAAAIGVPVSLYVTWLRIKELMTGRTIDPAGREVVH